jgi:hypothetical protein
MRIDKKKTKIRLITRNLKSRQQRLRTKKKVFFRQELYKKDDKTGWVMWFSTSAKSRFKIYQFFFLHKKNQL